MQIECEGAPRDLGFDQGRALGEGVEAELARILRTRAIDTGLRDLGRDVERHFPHLAERMAGLALGARVDRRALVVALARASQESAFSFRPDRAVAQLGSAPDAPALRACFELGSERFSVPLVRKSRPQGGFESLELTMPFLATSLGGVNGRGLAVVVGPPGLAMTRSAASEGEPPGRAPALLFAQQCLERFDCVGAALDWCMTRPGRGSLTLLVADASGDAAALAFDEERRSILRPGQDGVLRVGAEGEAVRANAGAVDAGALWSDAFGEATGGRGGESFANRTLLAVYPAQRSLAVLVDREGLDGAPRIERFSIEA